ncbi:MAG TPA: TonB-dependent receptor [Rhodanobacteraceae bacterium]
MSYRVHILTSSIVAALILSGPAIAANVLSLQQVMSNGSDSEPQGQTAAKNNNKKKNKTKSNEPVNLKEVTVVSAVGSNIAGVAPVGVEAINLDKDAIDKLGAPDIKQVLQTLPQVSNSAPSGLDNMRQGGTAGYGSANGGGNATQGVSVNLRGLGAQATLVLLDGHRVTPTGASSQFVDINQVPVGALAGIQVLSGGGSAIYGSDAVAGVVNLQIRKDFNGLELSPRASWQDGTHSKGLTALVGHTWPSLGSMGKGNFMVALDYSHRSAMLRSASPFLSDNLTRFGGVDNRIRGGALTTGVVNGGVGPGQPGQPGSASGGSGPIAIPGATSNVAWCDNYVAGTCSSGSYLYRALPTNSTATSYAETLARPSLADTADTTDFLGRQKTYHFDAFYNQDINSIFSIDFTGFYTHRNTLSKGNAYTGSNFPIVTVNPGTPFYLTPDGTAGGPMTVDLSPTALGLPSFETHNTDTNWTGILGAHAKLGGDWKADLSVTYGEDKACGECQNTLLDIGALQYYVSTGAINPLSTTPLTQAQLDMVVGRNVQLSKMTFQDDVLKFNGSLFDLPGGPLKMAVGAEYMRQTQRIVNGASRTDMPAYGIVESSALPPIGFEGIGCTAPLPCPPRTKPNEFAYDNIDTSSRKVHSAFVEFYIPVVSEDQDIPFVHSLKFDLADRYDHYENIGGSSNPKLSFGWALNQDVSIQGSWGKSFVAPNLAQSNPFVFSYKGFAGFIPNGTGNPDIVDTIPGFVNAAFVIGNRKGLKPQTATTWSLGTTITPHDVPHLKFNLVYNHLAYNNLIMGVGSFPTALLSSNGYAMFRSYVHPVNNPSDCSATNPHYDPALQPYISTVGIYGSVTPDQLCQVNVWVDGRNANVGSMTENAVDFNAQYMAFGAGSTWMFNLDATKVTSQTLSLIQGQPSISILGSMAGGGLVPWRGRASASWMKGPFSLTLSSSYVGTYLNDSPLSGRPENQVPSWTTYDLNATLYLGGIFSQGWLSESNVSLHINNVFDRDPPIVLTAGGAAFDAGHANIFGRTVSLRFTYHGFD